MIVMVITEVRRQIMTGVMRVQHGMSGLTLVQAHGQVSELGSTIPILAAMIPYPAGFPMILIHSFQGIMKQCTATAGISSLTMSLSHKNPTSYLIGFALYFLSIV